MKDKYIVSCGLANHSISIVNLAKPYMPPIECTDSAIRAVRDYMVDAIKQGDNSFGYSWNRTDGKTVTLLISIEEAK